MLSGELYNVLATGETVTVSPTESTLFPATGLYDGSPDSAFQFSAAASEFTITADGNRLRNGVLDAWSGAIPDSWGTAGTVAQTTVAGEMRSGSAARLNGGASIYQDFVVKSGERIVINGWRRILAAGQGFMSASLQDLTTGYYWTGFGDTWTAIVANFLSDNTNTAYTEYTATPFTVLPFSFALGDKCTLRLTLRNEDATETDYVYVDDWFVWPAVDFVSVHGHNIRPDATARLYSSPDNFATSSSGSTFSQATLSMTHPAFYGTLSSAIDHRYWQIRITHSASTPTETVWIGEVVIGLATTLTRPQDLGQELRIVADNVRASTPYGNTRVHRVGQRARRILGMSFNYFTSSEYEQARQEVFERSFGSAFPIVIVPDDTGPVVIHGRIDDQWAVRQSLGTHFTDNDLVVIEDGFPTWVE